MGGGNRNPIPSRHTGDQRLRCKMARSQEGIVVNLPSLRAHVPELDAYLAEVASEAAGGDDDVTRSAKSSA